MYALDRAAIATPIGTIVVEGDEARIVSIGIGPLQPVAEGTTALVREAARQLTAWFDRRLTSFDLPLAPAASPRGEALRAAIIAVRHGTTAAYGELAQAAGSSARAIGQACARNPLPLIVPCHRIVRTGGRLGPYSAGDGPSTKRWLLDFERSADFTLG